MDRTEKLLVIMRAAHETIRAYQQALGEDPAPPWAEAGWMHEATREAVEFALRDPTPGGQHEAWVAAKRRDGWRYGPKKDAEGKTHPSLVPFEALAESEKNKDALLLAVVKGLAAVLGVGRR